VARVVTIGVYEFDLQRFLDALRAADVGLVVDVRQRRGVRGSRYAWANSQRLQAALAEAGIAYSHHLELAPTTELRRLQYAADDRAGVGKRSRARLDPEYRERYVREVLDRADLGALVDELPSEGAGALLCVEADPEACHRSLIAERLHERHGIAVAHVRPERRPAASGSRGNVGRETPGCRRRQARTQDRRWPSGPSRSEDTAWR
jgi:uncharacterized protein (DUF488 family)